MKKLILLTVIVFSISNATEKFDINISNFLEICGEPEIRSIYSDEKREIYIYEVSGNSRCNAKTYCGAGVEIGLMFAKYKNSELKHVEFQYVHSCWKSIENRVVENDSSIMIMSGKKGLFIFDKKNPLGFKPL